MLNFIKKYFNIITSVTFVARVIVRRIPHPAARVATTVLSTILIIPTLKAIWDVTTKSTLFDTDLMVDKVITRVASMEAVSDGFTPNTEEYDNYVSISRQVFMDEDEGFTKRVASTLMNIAKVVLVILLVFELQALWPF